MTNDKNPDDGIDPPAHRLSTSPSIEPGDVEEVVQIESSAVFESEQEEGDVNVKYLSEKGSSETSVSDTIPELVDPSQTNPPPRSCRKIYRSPSNVEYSYRTLAMRKHLPQLRTESFDDDTHLSRWKPWTSWSLGRWRDTAIGCTSSIIVVTIRLLLDPKPTAYVIHSVIVLIDMLLIHVFTKCRWLSITGELTTVAFFLAFYFTKETVWELMETTTIAVLCSFHLIGSRNKHKEREEELTEGIDTLRQHSVALLRQSMIFNPRELGEIAELTSARNLGASCILPVTDEENFDLAEAKKTFLQLPALHQYVSRQHVQTCGERFFEYFLDGSAGVMYTSFLGLIIDELINYGEGKKAY